MNIKVHSNGLPLTDFMKIFITQKLDKYFSQTPKISSMTLHLKRDKKDFVILTNFKMNDSKKTFTVKTRSELFYSGLLKTRDRIKNLLSQKSKSGTRFRARDLKILNLEHA